MKKIIFLSLALTLILTGCGSASSTPKKVLPPHTPTTRTVDIKNFVFMPTTISIRIGDTLTWTNNDLVEHSIKSDTFNSKPFGTGKTFSYKFTKAGTFQYTCGIHPNMQGTVVVE